MQQDGFSLSYYYFDISQLSPILLIYILDQCNAHIHIPHDFPFFLFLYSLHQSHFSLVLFRCKQKHMLILMIYFIWLSLPINLIPLNGNRIFIFLFCSNIQPITPFPADFGGGFLIFPLFHLLLPFILYFTTLSLLGFSALSFNFSILPSVFFFITLFFIFLIQDFMFLPSCCLISFRNIL